MQEILISIIILFCVILIISTIYARYQYHYIISSIKKNNKNLAKKFNNFRWYPIYKYPPFHWLIFSKKIKTNKITNKRIKRYIISTLINYISGGIAIVLLFLAAIMIP